MAIAPQAPARILPLLLSHRLFADCDQSKLTNAIEKGYFKSTEHPPGRIICSPEDQNKRMILFLSGKAAVYTADEGRNTLLRTLSTGDLLGVSNLFSEEPFASRVIAEKKCSTLEISQADFGKLLENDPTLLYRYLSFLSEKLCYLNRKILCLTAGSAERRLACFLCDAAEEGDKLGIQMNMLSEMLNLGRASLYRAVDALVSEGFIRKEGKAIQMLNIKAMREKYLTASGQENS